MEWNQTSSRADTQSNPEKQTPQVDLPRIQSGFQHSTSAATPSFAGLSNTHFICKKCSTVNVISNRQLQANNWNRLESNSQRSEKIPLTLSRRQQGSVTRFLLARFRLPPLLSLWEPYLLSTWGSYHQKFSAETALGAGSKGWANTEETSRLGSKKRPLHRPSSAECSKTVIAGELAERLMAPVLKSDPFRSARSVPNPLQR
jgi:hypothetical protein